MVDKKINIKVVDGGGDPKPEKPKAHPKPSETELPVVDETHSTHVAEGGASSSKLKIIIPAVILLIMAALGFALLTSDSVDEEPEDTEQSSQSANQENTDEPIDNVLDDFSQVVYFHADERDSPSKLYARPVTGGDAVDLNFELPADNNPTHQIDSAGNSYAFLTSQNDLYFGTGANQPTLIASIDPGEAEINSMELDRNAQSILVTTVSFGAPSTNTILEFSTDAPNAGETYFTEESEEGGAIFVNFWDKDQDLLYARRSCWSCDGFNGTLIEFQGGSEAGVYGSDVGYDVNMGNILSQEGMLAFIELSTYTQQQQTDLGLVDGFYEPSGPPVTFSIFNSDSESFEELITVGETTDPVVNGVFESVPFGGWTQEQSTERFFYAYGSDVFVQNSNGGSFSTFFSSGRGIIQEVLLVDEDEIIAGTPADGGRVYSYFNIESQEGNQIFETSQYTDILTVTKE